VSATITVNTKVETAHFQSRFAEYLKVTTRSFAQAVNDKLFMIARAALWNTHKTDVKSISRDLGKVTYLRQKNHDRLYRHTLKKSATRPGVPLAALIVQKRQDEGKGLYGAAMRHAIQVMITARNVSVAYIKSGWLPAIQALAKVSSITAKNARDDSAARQVGRPKGRAVAAIADPAGKITGLIENEAYAKRDKTGAFEKYGNVGLQAGIDHEWKEMDVYIRKKMQPGNDQFNRSQR
jgi:hypothetical protein